jgi:excisionase family DNA binding protein
MQHAYPEQNNTLPSVRGLITKREVASGLQSSLRHVDNLMAQKKIPYIRLGRSVRFRWADIERALEKLTIKAIA